MKRALGVLVGVCLLTCIGCSEDQGAGLGDFCEKDGDCSGELVCRNNICIVKPLECEPACDPQAETCVEGQCVPVGDPNDKDGDGSLAGDDCDDFDRGVYPEAYEYCDGVDNDCDLQTDEGCLACVDGYVQDCGTDVGECIKGTQACAAGQWAACNGTGVAIELCDGKDNDCDGLTDEVCPCTDGDQQPCGLDEGTCAAGTELCEEGAWSGCRGGQTPQAEICDGQDNDCDGTTDEGFMIAQDCDGVGECGPGKLECAATDAIRCSTDPGGTADESTDEDCDLADKDCDGSTDEGCPESLETCPESSWTETDFIGGPKDDAGSLRSSICPAGQVVIGFYGNDGSYVDYIGVVCGTPALNPDPETTPPPIEIIATAGDKPMGFGGTGGGQYNELCDDLSPASLFVGSLAVRHENDFIHFAAFKCARLQVIESNGTFSVSRTNPGWAGEMGDRTGSQSEERSCPDNQVLYGIQGHVGEFVDNLKLLCCDIDLVLKE
jgi:hypothetical protein